MACINNANLFCPQSFFLKSQLFKSINHQNYMDVSSFQYYINEKRKGIESNLDKNRVLGYKIDNKHHTSFSFRRKS
jgi:hypothetical protein